MKLTVHTDPLAEVMW